MKYIITPILYMIIIILLFIAGLSSTIFLTLWNLKLTISDTMKDFIELIEDIKYNGL